MSPPVIIAPVPRRATSGSGSILDSDTSSDNEQGYRYALPNTPLQSSTPSALNQQLPLNGIPDTLNSPSSGGHGYTPHLGHNHTGSGGSANSNLSASSRKSARFSPNLTTKPPECMHNPPPPSATPVRSAMRQIPSPARNSPPHRFPAQNPDVNSVPNIQITHASSPSPASPTYGAHEPSSWRADAGKRSLDENDGDYTPGQRVFRPPSPPGPRNGSPSVWHQSPSEKFNDSGYYSPHSSNFAKGNTRVSSAQSQQRPQRASSTTSSRNRAGGTTTTNQNQQPVSSSSQVNQNASQKQPSGSRIRTSLQAPQPPHTCSPVVPGFSPFSTASSQSSIHFTSTPDPVRPPCAQHTPARPVRRATNRDIPRINTLFDHTAGRQFSARPRSSQARPPQQTPYGPTRTVLTPANGSGNGDLDVNSVVSHLFRVPPTSVAWQTPQGVLTWTPHPGLPDYGANLLGGGNGSGGRAGNADWWTGGHPMPGTCPTWTPGAWPPSASVAETSRRALIRLAPWMIPNPCNASLPHIMWDISQLPTTAKRITGNHVIRDVAEKLDDIATHPAVDRLVVVCQVGVAQQMWGCVEIKASRPKGVTVWDVFNGIFEYFQKRVGRRELDRMKEMLGDDQLEEKMADAFYQRLLVTPALPGYELKQGLKRVDCLGDGCFFWGLYVSYNDDNSWQLNLGLVNRRRYG